MMDHNEMTKTYPVIELIHMVSPKGMRKSKQS